MGGRRAKEQGGSVCLCRRRKGMGKGKGKGRGREGRRGPKKYNQRGVFVCVVKV